MGNKNMHKAKSKKNDEFYTQLIDIEKELEYYKDQLKNKVIYCNADTSESNFVKYFKDNFKELQLKALINSGLDGLVEVYDGEKSANKTIDGDFRSDDCIEFLKSADIVITNPPFSLFREYVAQLMEYEKEFLIIGNFNSVTYKEIFPLIKENQIWVGYTSPKEFIQPDGNIKKFGNISWFTNMDVKKRNEDIKLYQDYYGNEDKYSKYDNYDAINVDKVKDIPRDYNGVMGAPITFLTKFNPEQFEILGMSKTPICYDNKDVALRKKEYKNIRQYKNGKDVGSGNKINDGAAIIITNIPTDGVYYKSEEFNTIMVAKYARILIKNKKVKIGR